MNQGHNPSNPYSSPDQDGNFPPPRQGMPTWAKVLLVLGVMGGIGMIVCCGIFSVMMYGGYQMASNAFSTDPQVVAQRAQEIAQIEIMEGYQPKLSVDMKVPVTNQLLAKCALYARDEVHGVLLLAQAGREMVGDDPQQIYKHVREFLQEEVQADNMDITSTEEREFAVRGEPAKFEMARGTTTVKKNNEEKTVEFVRLLGSFPGQGDQPAILMLVEKADTFDEAAAEKMISSIQ